MWILRLAVLISLTGCLDGWEKNPSTEKGMPLAEKVQEKDYPAPSPAAFDLKLYKVNDDGSQDVVVGLVQGLEGDRIKIVAKGEIYDSKVEFEDIELLNPESMPHAQVDFDRARRELNITWEIPKRFVQSVQDNFQVSAPITVRMRTRYRSLTPEGTEHIEARQIESYFQHIVYRDFFGLEPTILRVEPSDLVMIENTVLKFDVILEDPGSTQRLHGYDPDVRVIALVPLTNTSLGDGARFVRRDKTKAAELVDPAQPNIWRVPMLVDLRGREVTDNSNLMRYGLQAISKYSLNNNISCQSGGECEFKEIASSVFEAQTQVYTQLQPVRTSMTFSPIVYAGEWNFLQWQIFDPEDAAQVDTERPACPDGAECSCSRVGRNKYSQCMLHWKPTCGDTERAFFSVYARSSSLTGPARQSSRIRFQQELRVFQDRCSAGGAP